MTPEAVYQALPGLDPAARPKLDTYVDLLKKWQKSINLVGPKTLEDPWRRHILDSAQLSPLIPVESRIVDLGSGAGLPGVILAITSGAETHLVESDQRKAVFLREAARRTDTPITVHAARAETLDPLNADVVTARALAPMEKLLPWINRHLKKGGKAVLLKGGNVDDELTQAAKNWTMKIEREQSLSDPSGTVLILTEIAPKNAG